MRSIKVWDTPVPPEVIFLEKSDITKSMCLPRKPFMEEVVRRVVRARSVDAPVCAVIANPREILRTRVRVLSFQRHLMRRLEEHLLVSAPHVLKRQPFMAIPGPQAQEIYRNARRNSGLEATVPGLDSYRFWHMDVWSILLVSICYYRYSGVRGGNPQFLDIRKMRRDMGLRRTTDLLDIKRVKEGISFPNERWAWLRKEYKHLADDFATRFVGLRFGRDMPIIVFSNRVPDGIMHGASSVKKTGKYPARSLSYISIAYA